MTRNQLFVAAAAAALMMSSVATSSYAGLVKIKLIMTEGGAAQSLTMVVPENCARTNWPSSVVACEDVDPEYQPNDPGPAQFVRSPSGRLFRLAELRIDGTGYTGSGTDRGHTEDIQQLGTTLGGGSSIGVATDQDGKVDLVLIDFNNDAAWNKFKSGEESGDLAATWTSVKARYGD
jgi:hypothetical protein